MTEFLNITPMLKTNDVLDTVEFYTQVLGFTVDTLWPADEPELCILDREDVHLMFDVNADWDAPGARPHLSGQLLIDVADVLALHAAVKDEVEILWGPEVYEYGRREFSIMDPNGYRLVFSEPTTDPPTCEG